MSAYKKLTPYASIKMFSYKNIDTNDVSNVLYSNITRQRKFI